MGLSFAGYPPALDDGYHNEISPLQLRVWKAHFGVCPRASHEMWQLISDQYSHDHPQGLNLIDYFMALFFLKTYPTFDVLAAWVKKDEKTVRKWVWRYVRMMAFLSPMLVSAHAF